MKVSRPRKVVTLAETQAEPTGWSGFLNKYGNSIATAVLVASAVFLFIRWRQNSAMKAHNEIAAQLQTAQSQVESLHAGRFAAPGASSADIIKAIQQSQTQSTSAIESLIGNSDADAQLRAQAFVLRGDMYWYLANLPPLAGSDSEASLRLPDSSDTLLTKSAESYQQVLKDPAFADQHQQINAAHLGLAAIAENKGDWDTAKKEFEAVANDPNAVPVLADQAKAQASAIAELKNPIYIAPPSGIATTAPAPALPVPLGPPLPTTWPTTVPSLLPTARPVH
jgi:hypothetical protein